MQYEPVQFNLLKKKVHYKALRPFLSAAGSLNLLFGSRGFIYQTGESVALDGYPLTRMRKRANYALLAGTGLLYQAAQHRFSISFTLNYGVNKALAKKSIGPPLFQQYGIVENNYRVISGVGLVSYEYSYSRLKRKR